MIQTEREELTALILQLKESQHAAGVADTNMLPRIDSNSVEIWDDYLNDAVSSNAEQTHTDLPPHHNSMFTIGPVSIEDLLIALPSNGTTENVHRALELTHRISHADRHLNRIRDLIAEKSFQYSHVIRVAPRKAVSTRSRAVIKKLNLQISAHCRMYSRCRDCVVSLGADQSTLARLKVLNLEDVKASTAILNPNEPGSTRIKLPWIWQTTAQNRIGAFGSLRSPATIENDNAEADSNTSVNYTAERHTTLFECTFTSSLKFNMFTSRSPTCPLAACSSTAHEVARRGFIDYE
jgi:hypothetical protein